MATATTVNYTKSGRISTAKVAKHVSMNLIAGLFLFSATLWLRVAYIALRAL